MTTYVILRKGKPVKVGSMPIVAIVASSQKQAVDSFHELHPRVKGRVTAMPILKWSKTK